MTGSPTRTAAPSAYQQIRTAIIEGRYEPGARLVEQRIAEEFELSRTPVREALRTLEAEGLVRIEPHRGATVRSLDVDDVVDLYALRARLEGYAAELAAQRHETDELVEIDEGIAAFGTALDAGPKDPLKRARALDAANARIHLGIAVASRHRHLQQMLLRTVDVSLVFRAFRAFSPEQERQSHEFHQMIRGAIAAREPGRAGALMVEHILQGRDVLLEGLRDQGQLPARDS
ncbi:GntR family transcriptional regulator [Nocardioides caeni]|uniref:GntR family transcriptional regulator n=1 Tax=Nocardioides caeni TaxID=574700 RepID=A0A4V4HJ46_9ACTN|nr:GntR family transcriptional regulator [Nocardioides caeni]THV09016.1 GntR family transcriptional regulator [Nocardioides caeni]